MKTITVETIVHADLQKLWSMWTLPEHITKWNHASDDWECPHAENDVRVGGKFLFRMSAKDGSQSFDFNGVYTAVEPLTRIEYTIEGGRTVSVRFQEEEGGVKVSETFEMEDINSEELQRGGWQAILNTFKSYAEMN